MVPFPLRILLVTLPAEFSHRFLPFRVIPERARQVLPKRGLQVVALSQRMLPEVRQISPTAAVLAVLEMPLRSPRPPLQAALWQTMTIWWPRFWTHLQRFAS